MPLRVDQFLEVGEVEQHPSAKRGNMSIGSLMPLNLGWMGICQDIVFANPF